MGNEKRESFIHITTEDKVEGDKTIRHDTWHVKNTSASKFVRNLCERYEYINSADMPTTEMRTRRKIVDACASMDALKEVDVIWDSKFTISYEVEANPYMKEFRGIIVEEGE